MTKKLLIYAAVISAAFLFVYSQENKIKLGNEILLEEKIELIKNKRIGVVTNTAALLPDGKIFIDALLDTKEINITAIFALEHGFELRDAAGVLINNSELDQIKIHSLYGSIKKPTRAMLNDINIILFDVQDIGARFYTYISSLKYILESAGQYGVKVIILDRPNPLGGIYVDGPVLEDEFKSFIGIDNIPVVHGMTIGELALFFNDRIEHSAEIEIVKMQNWKREFLWDELNLPWENPSPNILNFETVLLYPATCFFEGTNLSEGRGTYLPFNIFGAPFIDQSSLKSEIEKELGEIFLVRAIEFIPISIPDKAPNPKYLNEGCRGVQLILNDRKNYNPVETAIFLLSIVNRLHKNQFKMNKHFDLLWGTDKIRELILSGEPPEEIIKSWQQDLSIFKQLRKNYLIY